MSRLAIDRIGKKFGGVAVFDGLSLALAPGETVALAGPSGGGKTILLRIIAGLIEPDAGDIRIDGRSVVGQGPEGRNVGMAFQNFALYPHMSAFQNIASPLQARGLGKAELGRRVEEVASLLRIEQVLHHTPRELSNGQKQRTSLARALVRRPKVLLLDDPLRNVDAKLRYEMRLELPRLLQQSGSAVLYVTQDYREAMALGHRVGVLRAGGFEQIAAPGEVYAEPANVEIARFFGDPTINLYPCRPEMLNGGAAVELFGRPMPLDRGLSHAAGRDCVVGIRPEDVEVQIHPLPDASGFELDAVTPLSVRAVLFLRGPEGGELLATCPEDEAGRFGRGQRRVFARIASERALLFDRASGDRIRPLAA
jgi:multiple sugar transport system ATP-binding protein